MIPYDRLSDEERRKLIRDFSDAAKRIQPDPPAPAWGEKALPADPSAAAAGEGSSPAAAGSLERCLVEDSTLLRPSWYLRVKIDSYACSHGYALCGLRQYFASLLSFLSPDRDCIHPRFARWLVQDWPSPAGPSGYSLNRVMLEMERGAAFLLSGAQVLKRSSDNRALLRHAIQHDLAQWEPFGLAFLKAFLRSSPQVFSLLDAIRARTDLRRGVDVLELAPLVRAVFRAVLLSPASFEEIRRCVQNAGELIKSNYKRVFRGWSQVESICRKIDLGIGEFLGCYGRLRWFAHHLYPALLKLINYYEEERDIGRILPLIRQFVGIEEKDLLKPAPQEIGPPAPSGGAGPDAAPPRDGGDSPGGGQPPEPAVAVSQEYEGILTVLGYAFPGSRIERIGQGDYSSLFWFHQKILSREKPRYGAAIRRADFSELLLKISRLDPLAPVIVLYEILGEMIEAVEPGELGKLAQPMAASPELIKSRFEEVKRRWPLLRLQLFERYLQEIDFYEKEHSLSAFEAPKPLGETSVERRTIEIVNQIRNHVIRGYGWTAMSWDRTSYFQCEPLYALARGLYELLGQLTFDREQISRRNPLYVGRLSGARVARWGDGPIMRQIAGYIQAIPAERRLLADPAADGQRAFLEIFLGLADLLDFLLNDPHSPLRRGDGRVFVADAEDREIRRQIKQDQTPLRVEMRKDFEEVDRLTGLLGRNHYLKTAPRLFEAARESGEDLSLLMLDLDHFKAINDSHGHAFGDEILKAAAQVVLSSMREEDLAVRFGGEELLVLIRGDYRAAFAQGERVRVRLGEHLLAHFGRELEALPRIIAAKELEESRRKEPGFAVTREQLVRRWQATPVGTASVGVAQGLGAQLSFPCERVAELVNRADRMLYLAKDSGRNRVVGMVDRLRMPLLYEELTDYLLYQQGGAGRSPEEFLRHRESVGRRLRFSAFSYPDYLKGAQEDGRISAGAGDERPRCGGPNRG